MLRTCWSEWIFTRVFISLVMTLFLYGLLAIFDERFFLRGEVSLFSLKILLAGIIVGSLAFGALYWKSKAPWYYDLINPGIFIAVMVFLHLLIGDFSNSLDFKCVPYLFLSCGGSYFTIESIRRLLLHDFKQFFSLKRVIGFLLVIFISLVLSGISAFFTAREAACRGCCAGNLKQIGMALRMYSNRNCEQFPDRSGINGFEQLRSSGCLTNRGCYMCPTYNYSHKSELTNMDWCFSNKKRLKEKYVSYIYIGGMSEASSVDSGIVMDKPFNHDRYGNILFIDGHVKGYAGADWMMNAGLSRRRIEELKGKYNVIKK